MSMFISGGDKSLSFGKIAGDEKLAGGKTVNQKKRNSVMEGFTPLVGMVKKNERMTPRSPDPVKRESKLLQLHLEDK